MPKGIYIRRTNPISNILSSQGYSPRGYWFGKKRPNAFNGQKNHASGKEHWNFGGTYHGDSRKDGLKGAQVLSKRQPTSIEKTLYDYLLLKGFLFEKQKLINGKFIVDAYIPSLNLVIEADGKYWHDMDRVQKKDKAENAYLTKCGFNLVRLEEKEIKSGEFKERLVL
jgi:very-short-patch-repair endonuclease